MQQTFVLDELYEEGLESGGGTAPPLGSPARWHCREDGSAAGEDRMAWLFELRERRIRSWRPFEDRAEGLRAGGFANEAGAAG